MSILELLILALRIYLLTISVTLLLQMLTTARAQIHGIPLGDRELLNTIILAVLPGRNLVIAFSNLTMLFNGRTKFIFRYMYVRNRLDEIKTVDNKEGDKGC